MNIEEIKKRLATNEVSCDDDIIDLSPDVKYLLSIIEQAEKALERICTDPHTHRPARDFANQVLKSIQGDE